MPSKQQQQQLAPAGRWDAAHVSLLCAPASLARSSKLQLNLANSAPSPPSYHAGHGPPRAPVLKELGLHWLLAPQKRCPPYGPYGPAPDWVTADCLPTLPALGRLLLMVLRITQGLKPKRCDSLEQALHLCGACALCVSIAACRQAGRKCGYLRYLSEPSLRERCLELASYVCS